MLLAPYGRLGKADDPAAERERSPAQLLDLRAFWLFLRRRARLIAGVTLLSLGLAALALMMIPPRYTATAVILVDPRQQRVVQSEAVLSGIGSDAAAVESQVEVLESTVLARRIIAALALDRDPEFSQPALLARAIERAREALGVPAAPDTPERVTERTVGNFADALKVRRRGLTYVLEVAFVSRDPEKSARIANALADAYLSDQLNAKLEATSRAADWLTERSEELRRRASGAERAVADFKAANNIVDTAEGKTLADRQIAELSQQLILARARTAETKSRLDQALKASRGPNALGNLPESLQSPVIANLRAQYAQLARTEADTAATFGNRHPTVTTVRAQVADLRRQIEAEIGRVAQGLRNEFEAAQSRERSLDASLGRLRQEAVEIGQASVRLRELERDAQATRALVEQFLLRAKETSEQENLQRADARILSPAAPPLRPSFPRPLLLLALAGAGGLVLGLGLAALLESASRTFRTPQDVEAALGVPVLGLLPLVGDPELRLAHESRKLFRGGREVRLKRFGVDRQLTPFGEALRGVRTRLTTAFRRDGAGAKVLLVASAVPDEGKSTVAANVAHSLARAGFSTLLVDADVRRPELAVRRAPGRPGLLEALRPGSDLDALIQDDKEGGLKVLSVGSVESTADAAELVGSKAMPELIERLRRRFEVVVLDAPPLLPYADARQLANWADQVVLVVAWGATDRDSAAAALDALGPNAEKVSGAVLNKVDLRAYPLYSSGYAYQESLAGA